MVKKTQFEAEIPTSKTRDDEVIMTLVSSIIEGQVRVRVTFNYQLTYDKIRRKIIPP